MRLTGKVAIVTGSTKAIGAVIAREFAAQGACVAVSGRTESDGHRVVEQIVASGGRAIFVRTDVTVESDIKELVRTTAEHFGRVDVLVNNAYPVDFIGSGGDAPVDQLSTENWDYLLRAGVYGPFWGCKYVIPEMRKVGGGSIINISSMASRIGLATMPSYCTAKAGLNGLTRQVAIDYGKERIRSNAILIGFVLSGVTNHRTLENPHTGPIVRALSVTRMGRCEDVASAAAYLASDEAEFITGIEFPVDGGAIARGFVFDPSAAWEKN